MSTTSTPGRTPSPPVPLGRVAAASCAGTTIEFYDFFIYGTAAALVFPKVFFPALGSTAGIVASFATFAVAFFARPVGAVVFGHYGDRIGRKRTLISTLLLMGVATVLIGLLPGADTIGVAAPIILVVLRFAQGFAVGGEWAGATLLTAEYAPKEKRGLYGVFPQLGPAIAFALSSATFLITGLVMGDTDEAFLSYGWRIPFLLSILLVGVGLWVRLSIEETPAFKELQQRAQAEAASADRSRRLPFLDAVRAQPREVLLSAGALAMLFAFFYMGTAYLTSYGTNPDGAALARPVVLGIGIVVAVVFGIAIVVAGVLSDRFGRRNVIRTSCIAGIIWALVLFPLLDTGSATAFAIGLSVTMVIFAIAYGPAGSYLPELFAARYRYTGAGLGYNLAGVLGGAIPPLLAASLAASFGSFAIGVMLSLIGVLSLVCVSLLPETRNRALEHEQVDETVQA
ncbi:MHS family MFS transporter [Pseudonocardia sp. KRD-184]|uniref:MHS family MFS transporter n=1 Tax=Pseudonocardia oceani TaxID=2792013 RepID=A0ABS6U5Y3_9PSEU|nr:MFS transporter [Pseudonocardia oceani]MBW0090950.1 MHS family MFS transporter [Pseudonocardia oceani]MBW0094915.1 MHS family MFS transporter [Pseudonocardia oceani]MBW0109272.1 MHS family MFS transporter [Pseudonocardia oceani]MBW0120766.1 MHS family MFS transporter [Pseudonocardia oceani]MBW0127647.1 MHS family MFS transporter [Pseudonocardia oceani]